MCFYLYNKLQNNEDCVLIFYVLFKKKYGIGTVIATCEIINSKVIQYYYTNVMYLIIVYKFYWSHTLKSSVKKPLKKEICKEIWELL